MLLTRRMLPGAIGALMLATGGVACAADDGEGQQVIRVYSGRHYGVEEVFERFQEETGIRVEALTGNDAELRDRIETEGDDTEADVYLTVDAGNLAAATADGVFRPIESDILDEAIPESLRDPEGNWYGLAVRARTIAYNSDLLDEDEAPTTYAELAEPSWKGRVCMRNATSPYQQSLVASLIELDGADATKDVLEGWAENADIFANDVEIVEAIGAGACEVGIVNHYYLARSLEEDPDLPVELVWADQDGDGVHLNLSGAGVTAAADDPELAQQLIEWLATTGQDQLVADNHEYPANPEIEAEPLIAERFGTDFARQQVGAAAFGARNAEAVRLMDETDFG